MTAAERPVGATWWRGAVIYQVYLRSFADGDGDGLGDLAGLRSRLPYLVDLGVDAIWINPWYPSPMVDAGYDVSDYRSVDPRFGTLSDAEALLEEAHEAGLRVLLDIVPNHTSDQHPWFQAALAAGAGSPERERYLFRPGRGEGGNEPPNDWRTVIGSSVWTRVVEPDGGPGEWYLHLFSPEQPDLDWSHPEVRDDFEKTLRFWFDRGVDGFRIDVAHSLVKQEGLPDLGHASAPELLAGDASAGDRGDHPAWDRDEVHEIYREWRAIADAYPEPRIFVAEAWVHHPERLARYVRSDELHAAFNFFFLLSPWRAPSLRRAIDETLVEHAAVGAPPTWVLSNHDTARHVSRYAREQVGEPGANLRHLLDRPADLALGTRRARAAALLMLALPGSAYLYQGEELGLPEVEDLPVEVLDDPVWERSGHTDRGRDGCRVPIPWEPGGPPYGFSPPGASAPPWLPQPPSWDGLAVAVQSGDPGSMLELYRAALRLRRAHPALGDGPLRWLEAPDGALAFARDPGFGCVVNLSGPPVPLPAGAAPLLASGPLTADGAVPGDTAVWLRTDAAG
jgi:alpha-glucosidase